MSDIQTQAEGEHGDFKESTLTFSLRRQLIICLMLHSTAGKILLMVCQSLSYHKKIVKIIYGRESGCFFFVSRQSFTEFELSLLIASGDKNYDTKAG